MTIEKKMLRSDIPGHQAYMSGNAQSASDETSRLIVAREISLIGRISACSHLIIEGTVQAEHFSAQRLDILEPGLFIGVAEVNDAVIAGCFEGQLVVTGKLIVKSSGQICGNIEYGTLEMEAGAKIEGQIAAMAPMVMEEIMQAQQVQMVQQEQSFEDNAEEMPQNVRRVVGY